MDESGLSVRLPLERGPNNPRVCGNMAALGVCGIDGCSVVWNESCSGAAVPPLFSSARSNLRSQNHASTAVSHKPYPVHS